MPQQYMILNALFVGSPIHTLTCQNQRILKGLNCVILVEEAMALSSTVIQYKYM